MKKSKTIIDEFTLSRDGMPIGTVRWTRLVFFWPRLGFVEGRFEGDAQTVALVEAAAARAIADGIDNGALPPETGAPVTHPELYDNDLLAALLYAGYDILPDDHEIMIRIRGIPNPPPGMTY
ncbi:hypothetical protein [Cardiobacterium valvarum]|jgi:hypothetical protein|uniref:Uncharacterized protein n=1 Tax=Cardiobacterium valvarum F0432 TaxID=797473 RepID=G9ZDI6_9GAMM|nr:hypothetical protein [Cardiobacterium valvarum]EHM55312.1 hypothetical protein HMPREF9080_00820 [Cardiobacterium valvarum F0432]DAQ49056.1 MAG TPA: hypothetical protein [Caudoviricetes sp.]